MDAANGPSIDDWITIPGWERFQHYRNRNPLWIKLYAKLLHDPAYLSLSLASRGLLTMIWLGYSQENGQLSVRNLMKITQNRVTNRQLVALNHAGFIGFSASKPLAAKKEKEVEKESPNPLTDEDARRLLAQRALDVAADWNGGPSENFDLELDRLECELEIHLSQSTRSKLWDQAWQRDRLREVHHT